MSSLPYTLIFSFVDCIIQDNQTKEKIGSISVKVGFYVFNYDIVTSRNNACNNTLFYFKL